MNIPELLKDGFLNKNWDKISEAYALLTGIILTQEEPKRKPGRPKKSGVETVATVLTPTKQNGFVDDGKMHQSDKIIDKKLWSGVKQVERRPEVKKIKVNCRKCGVECEIFDSELPVVIEGSPRAAYVCNTCQGKR